MLYNVLRKRFLGPYKITQIKHFLKTLSAHLAKRFQNVFVLTGYTLLDKRIL